MRRVNAYAAALLLATAPFAPGCDLVDSLTPFGIGHQDSGAGGVNINGVYAGETIPNIPGGQDQKAAVTFQVGSEILRQPSFSHKDTRCTLTFEDEALEARIIDKQFSIEIFLEQGRFTANGTFSQVCDPDCRTVCAGEYQFEGLPAGDCPTDGSGTFTAAMD